MLHGIGIEVFCKMIGDWVLLLFVEKENSGDIGVIFNYYTSSAKKAAVYWDDSTSRVVVSQDVSESSGVLTNNTGGALEVASLYVSGCSGTTDEVIGCDGNTIVITNATIDGGSFWSP